MSPINHKNKVNYKLISKYSTGSSPLEGDNLEVFYYLSTSEIWLYKGSSHSLLKQKIRHYFLNLSSVPP